MKWFPDSLRSKAAQGLDRKVIIAAELLIIGVVLIPFTLTPVILLFAWILLWLRRSSWRDVGLRKPSRWLMVLLVAIPLGAGWSLLDMYIVEPWIEGLTGKGVDLSVLVGLRENVAAYVIMLGIVWTWAAFGEELLFRGYLIQRINQFFGSGVAGTALALLLASAAFGFAHAYQGISGMIETGYVGFGFGLLYLASGRNLWLPILVHGIYDTVGITYLYLGNYPGVS